MLDKKCRPVITAKRLVFPAFIAVAIDRASLGLRNAVTSCGGIEQGTFGRKAIFDPVTNLCVSTFNVSEDHIF